jgi:U32 family peptidase
MSNQYTAPELLMPAGDIEKLKYAFAYGADAVYAGVPMFSLRARENSFTLDSIAESISYAHSSGKRIYLTMNIYAHNSKINTFLDVFCRLADLGPDGFIMSDVGLIAKTLKLRPGTAIHLSTQANATNWTAVEFYRDLGLRRIILCRELSLKEIAVIHEKVPDIELEAFVHGAICVAYSGRCLISNYLNYRDANQGTCANSCRWQYRLMREKESITEVEQAQISGQTSYVPLTGGYCVTEAKRPGERFAIDEDEHGTYLMNSKDLCAIEILKEMRDAGVCSFKVEGRTKSVYYIATIARAYRRAIDDLAAGKPFNKANLRDVMSTSSRTLMTGFYLRRPQECGENFDDGDSLPLTHRFAGIVKEYDETNNLAWVETKGKIERGDVLEWITPTETVPATVQWLLDKDGLETNAVSGGLGCFISSPVGVNGVALLRKQIEQ